MSTEPILLVTYQQKQEVVTEPTIKAGDFDRSCTNRDLVAIMKVAGNISSLTNIPLLMMYGAIVLINLKKQLG